MQTGFQDESIISTTENVNSKQEKQKLPAGVVFARSGTENISEKLETLIHNSGQSSLGPSGPYN